MDANPYPLRQILALERRYVVPTFQRDYEWTKDGQWELLFDDLDAIAQRLGGARRLAAQEGRDAAEADRDVSPHFLGAVVLDQLPSPVGGIGMRAVIDGQQRITTLQLLIRGLGVVAQYLIRLLFAAIEERLKTENRLTEQTAVPYPGSTEGERGCSREERELGAPLNLGEWS